MADMTMDSTVPSGYPLTPMEIQVQQQSIDRQRQIAQYLQQQSLTPEQGQMISGHYVAPSAMQYISKLAQGLMGTNRQSALDKQQMNLATQQGNMIRGQFGMNPQPAGAQSQPAADPSATPEQAAIQTGLVQGAQAGSIGPTNANLARVAAALQNQPSPSAPPAQSAPAQPQRPSSMVIPGMSPGVAMQQYFTDPSGYNKDYRAQFAPTDLMKTLTAAGIDPNSAQGQQMLQANIAKTNYITPPNFRPGGFTQDTKTGAITNFPKVPEGFQAISDGKGGFTFAPVNGAMDAIAASAAALKQGQNKQTLAPREQLVVNPDGTRQPATIDAIVNPPKNSGFPPGANVPQPTNTGAIVPGQSDTLSILQQERAAEKDPVAAAALDRAIARTGGAPAQSQGVGAPFGQEAAAINRQKDMSKKFADLTTANQQAATTNSYLQNIKGLAGQAGVGAFSDKQQLTNNLLSYIGRSERATDAVTAKNLLDKYSSQITARLGGGSGGSDARSAIIEAAYPNSHMTVAAINDAVDNLVGANQMIQAKTALLSPHANSGDPVSYQQKEQIFDTNADPRIWQYKNIQDPVARKAFAASVMKQDPSFPTKIQALENIGAIK